MRRPPAKAAFVFGEALTTNWIFICHASRRKLQTPRCEVSTPLQLNAQYWALAFRLLINIALGLSNGALDRPVSKLLGIGQFSIPELFPFEIRKPCALM